MIAKPLQSLIIVKKQQQQQKKTTILWKIEALS